ncbi:transcriptional regulator EutR [Roseibium album]|nr:transcriptional regulator EutR [Roseibium album]
MSDVTTTHRSISCIDDIDTIMNNRNAETELTQIDHKPLVGASLRFQSRDTSLEYLNLGNAVSQAMLSRDKMALGIWLHSHEPNSISGQSLTTGVVWWAPPGRELHTVMVSNAESIMVTVPCSTVEQLLEKRGLSDLAGEMDEILVKHPPKSTVYTVVPAIRSMWKKICDHPGLLNSDFSYDYAFDFTLNTIIDTISQPKIEERSFHRCNNNYSSIYRRFEDTVRNIDDQVLTINRICTDMEISRRTLHRAVEDAVGVSPSDYLRNWRLTRSRKCLKELKCGTVTECAMRWGFCDVGRYASYYKELFGELPSVTLSKSRGSDAH